MTQLRSDPDDRRADPDQILKDIQKEEASKTRGHLHIFFGYAAGVGKTYAMLKQAHRVQKQGIDVVVGYVEPHMRPETTALLEGLEILPTKPCQQGTMKVQEFDLDAALKRRPRLILVDELAHTNAVGCRHEKRYQDVEELLAEGIDVYTTLNVQHIESLNDMVASITGIIVRERIPDKMFDDADQVKLVDIEPEELLERMKEGKIYREAQAKQATNNFFTVENLTALREIALRRCADRVNLLSDDARMKSGTEYYTDEHILVCISSSQTNQKIIRNASRMAKAFRAAFTALYVETPQAANMIDEEKKRLRNNIHLAEQLGATVETAHGDDIAYQIAEFARLSGVSKIVVGRNTTRKKKFFKKASLTDRLIAYAPNLDIYVIPDQAVTNYEERHKRAKQEEEKILPSDIIKSVSILAGVTVLGLLFDYLSFSESNIIMVYILGVLITAVVTTRRRYSIISSILSVLAFNFFFTEPRYTLIAYDSSYVITFVVMFLCAFITSSLGVRIQQNSKQSAAAAYRTRILLETNQKLMAAKSKQGIVEALANQLMKLLQRDVIFYLGNPSSSQKDKTLSDPIPFSYEGTEVPADCITEKEQAVALWSYRNNKHAGATTGTLGDSKCMYLAIRVNDTVYGVVGIVMGKEPLDSFDNGILLSILGEGAMALESEQADVDRRQADLKAKNEQLRADLLSSISQDLRAPLASIVGNTSLLLSEGDSLDAPARKHFYLDIYDDANWLINQVEDILTVTQIEEGKMSLNRQNRNVREVVENSLKHADRKGAEHEIRVESEDDMLCANMDVKLIEKVIVNMVDNAIKYTEKGSHIVVRIRKQGEKAVISVEDDGDGVADSIKGHVFDMFYTGNNKKEDGSHSMGLGLALCKSIVDAHGEKIAVTDARPHGAVFTFTLPAVASQG